MREFQDGDLEVGFLKRGLRILKGVLRILKEGFMDFLKGVLRIFKDSFKDDFGLRESKMRPRAGIQHHMPKET